MVCKTSAVAFCTQVLKCKRHPDGTYDKHRARLVICGHKGFMPRHEYKDTFAASPDIETSRLVQVLALISGWNRLAFDVSVACGIFAVRG
eukprot:SAG25_NODE_241_length_11184_cov_4.090934_15_plen_90_part_00